jgi:hypothetical protein
LRKLDAVSRPLINTTGTPRRSHWSMKLGHTSSSISTTTVGRSVSSSRETGRVKSSGKRTSRTFGSAPYSLPAASQPTSVVVVTTNRSSGRASASVRTSARVAFISPRLTAWIMTAGPAPPSGNRRAMRSRSARSTFRRARGRRSQNGAPRPSSVPHAMS